MTPSTRWNTPCTPQKQPPANTAVCVPLALAVVVDRGRRDLDRRLARRSVSCDASAPIGEGDGEAGEERRYGAARRAGQKRYGS